MSNLMKHAIHMANKIANKYQEILSCLENNENIEWKKKTLLLLLKKENSLYKLFSLEEVDNGIEYLNKHYEDIYLEPLRLIEKKFYFNPYYRVYSHLLAIETTQNLYNEFNLNDVDKRISFAYIFQKYVIKNLYNFFENYFDKKSTDYLDIKFNLIYSDYYFERMFLESNYGKNFNVIDNAKFLRLPYIKEKIDDEVQDLLLEQLELNIQEDEEYYESNGFLDKAPIFEFNMRFLYYLLQDKDVKKHWQKQFFESSINAYYEPLRKLFKDIYLKTEIEKNNELQLRRRMDV